MKTVNELKAAIVESGIAELFAQSAALWFKAARVALFFRNTNPGKEIQVNEKSEPIGLIPSDFETLQKVNKNETLRDAEKRLRNIVSQVADNGESNKNGKATVSRKGKAGISGISIKDLPDRPENKALKAIASLKADLFAQCVSEYATGKKCLSGLFNEFTVNGNQTISLNPELVAIAHCVIVELERDDSHKSLNSFAWYPTKGTKSEKDTAIAKAIRSHYRRIDREKDAEKARFDKVMAEAEAAESAESEAEAEAKPKAKRVSAKRKTADLAA